MFGEPSRSANGRSTSPTSSTRGRPFTSMATDSLSMRNATRSSSVMPAWSLQLRSRHVTVASLTTRPTWRPLAASTSLTTTR